MQRVAFHGSAEYDEGDQAADPESPGERMERVDPQIEVDQCERLAALRADRDNAAVEQALEAVREAARGTDNLLYPMKEALRAKATVGELCNALRDVWGVYVPPDAF